METACINSPLGTVVIKGDERGISSILVTDAQFISGEVHPVLRKAALELAEYFNHGRTSFSFTINPCGTEFQKKGLAGTYGHSLWKLHQLS